MQTRQSTNVPGAGDVLMEWMKAVTAFHENYALINNYLSANTAQKEQTATENECTGQCSAEQCVALRTKMQHVLEKLLVDMFRQEESDLSISDDSYRKLTIHTQILTELNQQAQAMLYLTTSSVN
ncbi:hypothetical protein [Spirosoma sp.]|uniref:hypothetical protein n=1 Tax=Spirosoma sp. TaxID=1899569 RepID=UPI003B3A1271